MILRTGLDTERLSISCKAKTKQYSETFELDASNAKGCLKNLLLETKGKNKFSSTTNRNAVDIEDTLNSYFTHITY